MTADIAAPIILSVLLVLSGLFSGAETALFSLQQGDIATLTRTKTRLNQLVLNLLNQERQLLLCILIANNIVNISYFTIAAWWSHNNATFSEHTTAFIFISLSAIVLCGEIFPKVIASGIPLQSARILAIPISICMFLCAPFIRVFQALLGRFMEDSQQHISVSHAEIKSVIEDSRDHGIVSELIHDRLLEIIDLSTTPVHSVMTHRVSCAAVDIHASLDDARHALIKNPGPFVIIVDEDDNESCVGLLAAQDILKGGTISKRMRKPLYIPSGADLPQAIELFQQQKKSAGIVVDEYGGTDGLLTLAHIGQELLGGGNSEDIPDREAPQEIEKNVWRLSGQTPLKGWENLIATEDTENCTTISGFVMSKLDSIPEVGDRLLYRQLLFIIESVDGHRIHTLMMRRLSPLEARRCTRNMSDI